MNFYERFILELDALTIKADMPAAAVCGELIRAAKRAQMVVDGELPPVSERAHVVTNGLPYIQPHRERSKHAQDVLNTIDDLLERCADAPRNPRPVLTCPKCKRTAEKHCYTSPTCDLIKCNHCGYGTVDGHLWHTGK